MKWSNRNFPLVRLTEPAHKHLKKIVAAQTKYMGRRVSMMEYLSNLLMGLPMPGNGDKPDPYEEEKPCID
jgi:hypothetical protein